VNVDAVRRALPEGAALVELVRCQPRDFAEACAGREGLLPARYFAFVLHAGGVAMADAGPADVLEGRGGAEQLRSALVAHVAGHARLVVGHGGLRRAAWRRLAAEVRGLRSGRELASGLAPPAGWLEWARGWLGL